jgi:hypothetical protein
MHEHVSGVGCCIVGRTGGGPDRDDGWEPARSARVGVHIMWVGQWKNNEPIVRPRKRNRAAIEASGGLIPSDARALAHPMHFTNLLQ